jgi:hypothetical protein
MRQVVARPPQDPTGTPTAAPLGPLTIAAFASIGAGAIHAAAIGMHREHDAAVVAFALMATFQFGWGVAALTRTNRALVVIGIVGNGLAIAAWVRAKTSGIDFVSGLDEAESVQLADGLAALLAAIAVGTLLLGLVLLSRRPAWRPLPPRAVNGLAVVVLALTLTGMIATGGHDHAGGSDHDGHGRAAHDDADGEHDAAVAPRPYEPGRPIDLGGVDGVSPEQQARAENLLAVTLVRLPQFADPATAETAGFHSIGDALTGDEHYINWAYVNDDKILDPDYPESLVYQIRDGRKTLVAAMFMLPDGSTLDTAPDIGGALTQWHVHDNLCFTDDPVAPVLAFGRGGPLVGSDSPCPPPTQKRANVPMLHVWIVPHPCGPFAALEGVGAGQIEPGEKRLCDHAHGAE